MAAEPALRQVGIWIISSGSIEGQLIKGAMRRQMDSIASANVEGSMPAQFVVVLPPRMDTSFSSRNRRISHPVSSKPFASFPW